MSSGEDVVITVSGKPVARLVPVVPRRRRWLRRHELGVRLQAQQADAGLHTDLVRLAGETTDALGPIGCPTCRRSRS